MNENKVTLSLNKETIAKLNNREMGELKGGITTDDIQHSCMGLPTCICPKTAGCPTTEC